MLKKFNFKKKKTVKNIDEKSFKDFFTSHSWVETEASDGNSYLVFESGEKFKYYREKGVDDNYYCIGTYDLYVGDDAVDYVVNDLSMYGFTKKDIDRALESFDQCPEYCFFSLVLNNEQCIIDGNNTLQDVLSTPYYCVYYGDGDDGTLLWLNLNTSNHYFFKPE